MTTPKMTIYLNSAKFWNYFILWRQYCGDARGPLGSYEIFRQCILAAQHGSQVKKLISGDSLRALVSLFTFIV